MTIEELELRVTALERNCADLQRWKRETINSNKAQDRLKRNQAIDESKREEARREERKINRQMKNKMK